MILWQSAVNFKLNTEIQKNNKFPYQYTILAKKLPFLILSWTFYRKRAWKCNQKRNLRQNTICLDQQIYVSQADLTHLLVVMVETFRRSARGPSWRKSCIQETTQPLRCVDSSTDKKCQQQMLTTKYFSIRNNLVSFESVCIYSLWFSAKKTHNMYKHFYCKEFVILDISWLKSSCI